MQEKLMLNIVKLLDEDEKQESLVTVFFRRKEKE